MCAASNQVCTIKPTGQKPGEREGTLVTLAAQVGTGLSHRIVNQVVPHIFSSLCFQDFGLVILVSVGYQHTFPVAKWSPVSRHAVQGNLRHD